MDHFYNRRERNGPYLSWTTSGQPHPGIACCRAAPVHRHTSQRIRQSKGIACCQICCRPIRPIPYRAGFSRTGTGQNSEISARFENFQSCHVCHDRHHKTAGKGRNLFISELIQSCAAQNNAKTAPIWRFGIVNGSVIKNRK